MECVCACPATRDEVLTEYRNFIVFCDNSRRAFGSSSYFSIVYALDVELEPSSGCATQMEKNHSAFTTWRRSDQSRYTSERRFSYSVPIFIPFCRIFQQRQVPQFIFLTLPAHSASRRLISLMCRTCSYSYGRVSNKHIQYMHEYFVL